MQKRGVVGVDLIPWIVITLFVVVVGYFLLTGGFTSLACTFKTTETQNYFCNNQLAQAITEAPGKFFCGTPLVENVHVALIDPSSDSCASLAIGKGFRELYTAETEGSGYTCCAIFGIPERVDLLASETISCCQDVGGTLVERPSRCTPGLQVCSECTCKDIVPEGREGDRALYLRQCSNLEFGPSRYGVIIQYDIVDAQFRSRSTFLYVRWNPQAEVWEYSFELSKTKHPNTVSWLSTKTFRGRTRMEETINTLLFSLASKDLSSGKTVIQSRAYAKGNCAADSAVSFQRFGNKAQDHLYRYKTLALQTCTHQVDPLDFSSLRYRVSFNLHSIIQHFRYNEQLHQWEYGTANTRGTEYQLVTPYATSSAVLGRPTVISIIQADFYGQDASFGETYFQPCTEYDALQQGGVREEDVDACYFLLNNRVGRMYDIGLHMRGNNHYFTYRETDKTWLYSIGNGAKRAINDLGQHYNLLVEQARIYLTGKASAGVDFFDVCLAYGPYAHGRVLPTHQFAGCQVLETETHTNIVKRVKVTFCNYEAGFHYFTPSFPFSLVQNPSWRFEVNGDVKNVEDYDPRGPLEAAVIARQLEGKNQQDGTQYFLALCDEDNQQVCQES